MEQKQIKVIFDPSVNSLTVWFGNPADEDVATQVKDDLILMKDKDGTIIGFEKHLFAVPPGHVQVQFETLPLLSRAEIMAYEAEVAS